MMKSVNTTKHPQAKRKNNITNSINRLPIFYNSTKSTNTNFRQSLSPSPSPYISCRRSCKLNSIASKGQSVQNYRKSSISKNKQFNKNVTQKKRYKENRNINAQFLHYLSCTMTPKLYQTLPNQQQIENQSYFNKNRYDNNRQRQDLYQQQHQPNINSNYYKQYQNNINRNYFKFMYQIGFGGFGKVWKVQQKISWQYYAMKQISKRKVIQKDSIDCILNQLKILQNLHNNFLVNIKYAFQDKQNLYLIMDYLKGADLRYHICYRQLFTQEQTNFIEFILACLIIAVQEIHNKGIIHRDIKPQNLVLEESGYLRLTDFGIAKYSKQLQKGKYDSSGTPGYMAPQVLLRQNYNEVADYFAIGVIGYQLMLNRRPYVGKNRKQIKQKILNTQIYIHQSQLPQNWSKESMNFINKLIQKNQYNRLGSKNGIKQLKQHQWMKQINWKKLCKKQILPPFIPNIVCETKQYLQQIQTYNEMNAQQNKNKQKDEVLSYQEQQLFKGYFLEYKDNNSINNTMNNANNNVNNNSSTVGVPFRNIRNTLQKNKGQLRSKKNIKYI